MLVVLDSVDYSDGSFDNLVIQTNKSNETNTYIIHYTPSEEIKYNETHNSYSFEGTTQVSKVYGTTSFFGGSGLGNNGDNGNLGDDSNEGGTSNNAESSVICTTVILCNYEYVHIAGPGCKNTYSKTECYTNPNYNPWNNYSSGSGNEPEDEIGQNNNTGPSGGGMGSGGNTTNPENPITSTVFTEELYEEDVNDDTPCQTLKKQSIDNAQFAHKLDSLKQRVLSSNPNHDTTETLVNISRSGDDYSYKVSGSVSFGGGLTTVGGNVSNRDVASIHNHPEGNIPIFSYVDIVNYYDNYNFVLPSRKNEYTDYLVCFNGTTYALRMENLTALNTLFAGLDLGTAQGRKDAEKEIEKIQKKHGLNTDQIYDQAMAEELFMNVIYDEKLGGGTSINLYRKDADGWGKLVKNGTTITKEPCL